MVVRLHRGKEQWPGYEGYIRDHMGGPESRVVKFANVLCKEIEKHTGPLRGKRVLDFGCGTGATTAALANLAKEVVAFDVDAESVDIANKRIEEHGLSRKVQLHHADDFDAIASRLGRFDLVLMNGVIEHVPLSKEGLRKRLVRTAFSMLRGKGHLYINETPNRLWPYDDHSTKLWWIPWTKPGSAWAYQRAVQKGRHSDAPTHSPGPLGLEEVGAWGATYWEITGYLEGLPFAVVNLREGHDRHLYYSDHSDRVRGVFEAIAWLPAKILGVPMTALAPDLTNLAIENASEERAVEQVERTHYAPVP
jgi:SAM-dependent methyltransferase